MNTNSRTVNISSWRVNIKLQELKSISIKKVTIVYFEFQN